MNRPRHRSPLFAAAAAATITVAPAATAQPTAIAKPGNLQTWPAPQTLSPEGRAMVEMMGKTPLPDPWPPVAAQRQFADSVQAQLGAALAPSSRTIIITSACPSRMRTAFSCSLAQP